jgi:hypothetical protein
MADPSDPLHLFSYSLKDKSIRQNPTNETITYYCGAALLSIGNFAN